MSITYGDHLIDSGYYDITPEQERELWAREECARRGIDPDELCADGGVEAWMVVANEPPGTCTRCGGAGFYALSNKRQTRSYRLECSCRRAKAQDER